MRAALLPTRATTLALVVAGALGLAACGEGKPEVVEDFSDLAGLDQKSDTFSSRLKVLGPLGNEEVKEGLAYSSRPRFRAFSFEGQKGNDIDIWVRSADGDAIAWLLDGSFKQLAKNDDADGTTTDARIALRLTESGTYHIVFRELDLQRATFSVSLKGAFGPAPDDLTAFSALSAEAKIKAFFPEYKAGAEAVSYDLAPSFSEVPVRLVDTLSGALLGKALGIYRDMSRGSYANGGDSPDVTAVVKGGLTYGYVFAASGRSYGNWVAVSVYDAAFEEIGGWGYAD